MIEYAMTSGTLRLATIGAMALAVSGCMSQRTQTVTAIQPAPSRPVQSAPLAPPPTTEQPPELEAPVSDEPLPDPNGTDLVASTSPSPGVSVGRTDLLGGWTISSGGDSCQLFMSLTTWTGGYRASTRGCNSPSLAGIAAWDLNGSTVTLKGGDGAASVATLNATSPQSFSGSTAQGAGITVSR